MGDLQTPRWGVPPETFAAANQLIGALCRVCVMLSLYRQLLWKCVKVWVCESGAAVIEGTHVLKLGALLKVLSSTTLAVLCN